MNKIYRYYVVTFTGHSPMIVRASSDVRAIEYVMDGINSSLSRLYSGKPRVTLADFECLVDDPHWNQPPVLEFTIP